MKYEVVRRWVVDADDQITAMHKAQPGGHCDVNVVNLDEAPVVDMSELGRFKAALDRSGDHYTVEPITLEEHPEVGTLVSVGDEEAVDDLKPGVYAWFDTEGRLTKIGPVGCSYDCDICRA